MRTLIVGAGEIGKALYELVSWQNKTIMIDKHETTLMRPDIMHICFAYDNGFVGEVKKYQRFYRPRYTMIHSTVPVGTSRKLNAIHSPIIGMHPFLVEGIKTFPKYIGGKKGDNVADYFRRLGIRVYLFIDQETTELMKLLDTTFYAMCIEYTKDVRKQCEKYAVPFEAWTIWTDEYNKGYQKLGYPEYTRPNLVPVMRKIGGHCLMPNCELIETKFTKLLKK